jgi:uncharacterized protein YtpQ (UPF0354 family)
MFGLFGKKKSMWEPQARDAALLSLVPVVKAIEFEGGGKTIELPIEDAPISRPFVADLMILYAEDKPSHFQFVSSRRLAELGLTEDELHTQALQNLPSRPPKIELHGNPPKQMLIAGGNFEATLLLYDTLWDQAEENIEGELLAVAPARDLLFISVTSWAGAREFLTDVASRDLEDKTHMLSRAILRRVSRKWVADAALC